MRCINADELSSGIETSMTLNDLESKTGVFLANF